MTNVQWSVSDPPSPGQALVVPGNASWVDTGIDVASGEPLTIRAEGEVFAGRSAQAAYGDVSTTGPEGTFLYSDKIARRSFPLAAGAVGPAPCFCLIGRIGEGMPFFVGRGRSWKPPATGRLYLGINDFDVSDNEGFFAVSIAKTAAVLPISYQEVIPVDEPGGAPVPGCSVVVFYIDGLRPDVVREMAAMGHLPNINRLFLEGGAWMSNAVTGFPSDTITSNGTMWTGCFSDRHGLKGQVSFSRRTLESKSFLDPLGPTRSARMLAPQGLDRLLDKTKSSSVQVLDGEEASRRWHQRRVSGVPPVYEHLRHNGADWATGALPVMTEFPPVPWSRSLAKKVPYLQYHNSWRYMDDANADYATSFLFERDSPITIVWLPETDSVSHHDFSRGQFGTTRRTIARADELIGGMIAEVEGRHRLDHTYFILCSDHGHHGGQKENLSHFDIADEFFHKSRLVAPDGTWVGGGLGLSVRQHRFWNRHPGDRPIEFVYLDADMDGAARVFLPHEHYRSGIWYERPRPGDLLAYRIDDHLPPVDLIASLVGTKARHSDGSIQHPVDLVLVKLSDDSILIATVDRGNAVVHRKRDERGKWVYKYTVVEDLKPATDGGIFYREVSKPQSDPLGLVGQLHPRLLTYYHDETQWLRLTALTRYPDSIVALSRHLLWQENLAEQEREHAPDFVVTAREGWYFGTQPLPGTTHGYPFPDSMHASLFISGPNVRRGARIEEPCRLADLTPTMLDMLNYQVDSGDFDGHALRNIYQPAPGAAPAVVKHVSQNDAEAADQNRADPTASDVRPVYWDQVDLKSWEPLDYSPRPAYEALPWTVHHPYEPYDLHNIAYDLLSLSDLNVIRAVDDVLYPIEGGVPMVSEAFGRLAARTRHSRIPAISEAADTLDVSTTTIGDYSFMSAGNLKRIDGAIDWVQNRMRRVDHAIAQQFGMEQLPPGLVVNRAVDRFQWWFWDVYRFGQRVGAQVLDEGLLNSLQDKTDKTINSFRMQPAEIVVPPSPTNSIQPTPTQPPPAPPLPQ